MPAAKCDQQAASLAAAKTSSAMAHPHAVMDLPHHGRFLAIKLTRKRYRCKNCGTIFYHPLD